MDVSNASDVSPELATEQNAVAILFFDKDAGFVQQAVDALKEAKITVAAEIATRLGENAEKIASGPWDVIVSDFELDNSETAFEVLAQVRALGRDVPVIVFTSGLSGEQAAECIKRGACDYLLKENIGRFSTAVLNALEGRAARRERAQLEEHMRQNQKMESIGRLAGAVAHDFNNLLEIVVGYSELMLQDIPHETRLWKNADEIKKAGMRAASLTRQLLAFSRRQVLAPRLLDLNEVLDDMDRMLRRAIGDQVEVVTAIDSELWAFTGDPGQIEQVVMNLALHACETLHGPGKITITTANIELRSDHTVEDSEARTGPHVMLAVSSEGPETGMSEQAAELFTGQRRGGRGLGLAMVYEVVRQSHGHIWVQSTAKGTTFKIYFPREAQQVRQACGHKSETLPGMETLVLAEDESATRELIARVLANNGYRVLEASNGRDALGFFEQTANHVDLLITDLVMPVMGGGELARKVIELSPGTRVLYISGFSDDPNVRQGVLEGAAYLQKPFRLELLNCKVRELLDRPPLARMA